jgi:hypothetical protein
MCLKLGFFNSKPSVNSASFLEKLSSSSQGDNFNTVVQKINAYDRQIKQLNQQKERFISKFFREIIVIN